MAGALVLMGVLPGFRHYRNRPAGGESPAAGGGTGQIRPGDSP